MGPLKIGEEEMVSSGEVMCKILNYYFLSVFTKDKHIVPVSEQIIRREESEKL